MKNNLSYLFRKAIELEIVSNPASLFGSWKDSHRSAMIPSRHEYARPSKYVCDPVPLSLQREIKRYEEWSTRAVNRERPKSLQKRAITFSHHRRTILCIGGYLTKFNGLDSDSITLLTVVEAKNVISYIEWYIGQQGKYTGGCAGVLGRVVALGKYLQISLAFSNKQPSSMPGSVRFEISGQVLVHQKKLETKVSDG